MGGGGENATCVEEEVINTDHGCFLRSSLGSPFVPLAEQQWTFLGLLPRYKEEVCTIKRGGFACRLSQFIWK